MADRTLTTYDEVLAPQIGQTYTARIDRSAAGQPGIFFIFSAHDTKTGEFLHENCVVIPDGREFLAPVNEWLESQPSAPAAVPTLGDIAEILEELKAQGVTRSAVEYAVQKVFWEQEGEAFRAFRENKAYLAAAINGMQSEIDAIARRWGLVDES